jgi:hypothetical protein
MSFPDIDEEEEDCFEESVRNRETMSSEYDCCIIGQSKNDENIYSWKKMLKVTKSHGMDEYDAEDFLFRMSMYFPEHIIILMDN